MVKNMNKNQNDIDLSKPQQLNLELIVLARHNELNGKTIYRDLLKHRKLWIGVYGYFTLFKLVPLRDIQRQVWNIDTIEIMCKKTNAEELKTLAKNWKPNKIYELDENEILQDAGGVLNDDDTVIGFWWD